MEELAVELVAQLVVQSVVEELVEGRGCEEGSGLVAAKADIRNLVLAPVQNSVCIRYCSIALVFSCPGCTALFDYVHLLLSDCTGGSLPWDEDPVGLVVMDCDVHLAAVPPD